MSQPVLIVVDDEPLNRDLLKRVLHNEYTVCDAGDAFEAIHQFEKQEIQVGIFDHLMPGRSGTELARDVRERWPNTVCLLLTGYDDAPEVDIARVDGTIFEVIPKPWLAGQLRTAVARALAENTRRRG